MMRAIYVFAVVCWAAVADATLPTQIKTIMSTDGQSYALYKELIATVHLPDKAQHDLYRGLDIEKSNPKVTKQDLDLYYWHTDLKYAVDKFLATINDDGTKEVLEETEFTNDLKKQAFILALVECHYLLSPGLRQSCYADELLTYAALVLTSDEVTKFYQDIDTDHNGLTAEEVLALQHSHKNKDNKIIAEELGAYWGTEKNKVTTDELIEYMTQETIDDDFRECRSKRGSDGKVTYDKQCLLNELVEYINDDITEIDIALLFQAINTNPTDKKITVDELNAFTGITEEVAAGKIMKLLDMSATTPKHVKPEVDYAEFRTYMRSPTVLVQMEKDCVRAYVKQDEEIECMYKKLKQLLIDGHDPIWMEVWDLDQTIAFEIFDADHDDGKILQSDLEKIKGDTDFKHTEAITRFLSESDLDKDGFICLEEFDEYMDIPHMVYGTGDCLLHTRTKPTERGNCFVEQTADVIGNFKFIDNTAFDSWFNYYDTDGDKRIEKEDSKLKSHCNNNDDLTIMFLEELGQGGMTVELFEFNWYVKQQDLAHAYEDENIVKAHVDKFTEAQLPLLNTQLINYINNEMTEVDIKDFFDTLDKHKDHELTEQDFQPAVWTAVKSLIEKIDKLMPEGDDDNTVNFIEFWAWLNYAKDPSKPKDTTKKIFEKACTEKYAKQQQEIECYITTFKNPANFK